MAITRAQQVRQMLEDGGMLVQPSTNGKRPGYRGDAAYGRSSRSAQATSIGQARGETGPGGGASLGGGRDRDEQPAQQIIGGKSYDVTPETKEQRDLLFELANEEKKQKAEDFIETPAEYSKYTPSYIKFLSNLNRQPNRRFFVEKVLKAGRVPNYEDMYDEDFDLEGAYQDYMSNRMAGKTDAYGNPVQGFSYNTEGDLTGNFIDDRDDGAGQQNLLDDTTGDTEEEDEVNPRDYTGLAPRIMGSIFDFSGPQFAADGGIMRAGYMDGGRMRQMEMMQDEDDPTGGIMDLESGRQMYFLGKLVKKAGRAIKKVVKSPIGKAALLYFGGKALMGGGGGGLTSLFKSGKGLKLKNFLTDSIMGKAIGVDSPAAKNRIVRSGGLLNFIKDNPYLSILGGSTALAGLSGKDKDEDGPINYGLDIDIDAIRANPYKFLPAGIIGSNYQRGTEGRKDGGRMGYQEGGDAEPVAKKTMPLLDMGGMEKDYREEGGFVPIGRMERADDVPARLSKNEFVFTADAVRNAGDGDIDKGAEVMYNMMKNLESGGEVSKESQGLDGAREMFQTSKRLEEVL